MFILMTVGMNVELKTHTTGCFACSQLLTNDPDREGCLCSAKVGLPNAAQILEPAPIEPKARLEHLRRQAAMSAGAQRHLEGEAQYQDRWDRVHARDLRATAILYARTEQRLRREIEETERKLRSKASTKGKKKSTRSNRTTRRSNTRRTPRRTSRPVSRRPAQSSQSTVDPGGGGDPPPADSEPPSAHSHPTRTASTAARTPPASTQAAAASEHGRPQLVRPELTCSRTLTLPLAPRSQRTRNRVELRAWRTSQVLAALHSHPRSNHCESCVRLRVRPLTEGVVA